MPNSHNMLSSKINRDWVTRALSKAKNIAPSRHPMVLTPSWSRMRKANGTTKAPHSAQNMR